MIEALNRRVGSLRLVLPCLIPVMALVACAGSEREPFPDQPIAFSHKIHAGDYGMPCLYCHMYANRTPVAGVPTVKTCMGCHELIGTDKPEVMKLARFWEEKRPIEWFKVYDLPDFVHFNHNRHVSAGVECETCHGPVAEMAVIEKYRDLSMGWCLSCHMEKQANIDCQVCHY